MRNHDARLRRLQIETCEQRLMLTAAAVVAHDIRVEPGFRVAVTTTVELSVPSEKVHELQLEQPTDPTANSPAPT